MTTEQSLELLAAGFSGHLATVGADGFPYCTPLLYIWMDGELYLHTGSAKGHLRSNVDFDSRVCFEVDAPDEVFDYGRSKRDTGSFDFKYDGGGVGNGGTGSLSIDGKEVAEGRIEKTFPVRISLDESLDIGEDTGTPVIDDYEAKMPFKFSGTLSKIEIHLGPDQLTPEQHGELEKLKRDFEMAVQ